LPQVDELVLRDELSLIKTPGLNVIMNGWYTHKPTSWLPNENLNPLFVSFHLNSQIKDLFLSSKGVTEYLKKHQPIGCRDRNTEKYLKKVGVESYYTGCLTLTLDSYKVSDEDRTDDIYIVDPFFNFPDKRIVFRNIKNLIKSVLDASIFKLGKRKKYLSKTLSRELLDKAKYETHVYYNNGWSEKKKFEEAESLLKKYAKAKLVITSRIHCALPCLAMGTPVLFLNSFDNEIDTCRFDGLLEFLNVINIDSNMKISSNCIECFPVTGNESLKNNNLHMPQAEALKKTCKEFIKNV
jgi:hypothetical protein